MPRVVWRRPAAGFSQPAGRRAGKNPRLQKGIDWGTFYAAHKDCDPDAEQLEAEIDRQMEDEYVSNKKGIYEYVLTREERHLNIRAFNARQKREAFQRQKGKCPMCGKEFGIDEMESDHITPWHEGGKTVSENCRMLCRECNRRKGGK